jgi:hypothetical protein
LRASVSSTAKRIAIPLICCGPIDRGVSDRSGLLLRRLARPFRLLRRGRLRRLRGGRRVVVSGHFRVDGRQR